MADKDTMNKHERQRSRSNKCDLNGSQLSVESVSIHECDPMMNMIRENVVRLSASTEENFSRVIDVDRLPISPVQTN